MDNEIIQTLAVYAIPVLFAITLHEAAHGYVALRCGDHTARMAGRLTLNPLKHIDLMGTIVVPLVILLTSFAAGGTGMLFGWAKPVPVDFSRLNRPRLDMRLVAFAGPASNLLMALGWAAMLKLLMVFNVSEPFLIEMAQAGIIVNLVLAALNLLPILPLDGGRILYTFLPTSLAVGFEKTERFGLLILLTLLVLGLLPIFMQPIIRTGLAVIMTLFNF
ncbi:MAG: site-2 protease family protein [Limnobacter sp.]|nr:site-2 protease family protein [Limnobacter sp.]